jgi:hypothetical protein
MADTQRIEGSPRGIGAGSQSEYAHAVSQAQYPSYDAAGRASFRRSDDERYGAPYEGSGLDDLVPVLGMFIGGAVGFVLATMIPSGRSQAGRSSGRGMGAASDRGYGARSAAMGRTGASSSVEHDESTDLIASNKVEGTAVYNRQGERLGEVHNFMVGKRSGRVAYAVMSFGGFLGIGQRYHALPWSVLTYDTNRGGYLIDADRDRLMTAPHYSEGEDPFSQSENMQRIRNHWSSGRLSL